jgi:hypothetical protein
MLFQKTDGKISWYQKQTNILMNIDAQIITKCRKLASTLSSKDYSPWSNGIYSYEATIAQSMQNHNLVGHTNRKNKNFMISPYYI